MYAWANLDAAHSAPGHGDAGALWVLSDGRSGSTWYAELLNCEGQRRIEHEPIHPDFTPQLAGQPLLPLPGCATLESVYAPLIGDVLEGRYRSQRFHSRATPPDLAGTGPGLLIRDIYAMLIAPRLMEIFPQIRPTVIVRHPFDVATSKIALSGWHWFSDVASFLDDPRLAAELAGLEPLVARAHTPFQRYAISWAVCHRWFFSRIDPASIAIIRYPGTAPQLRAQLAVVLDAEIDPERFMEAFNRRSATDRPPTAHGLRAQLQRMSGAWQQNRSYAERIIDSFGLRWLLP